MDLENGVETASGNTKAQLKAALHEISAANIIPGTWDLPFGSNVHGIYGATPPEMLHQYDLGLLRTTWECEYQQINSVILPSTSLVKFLHHECSDKDID